ncbi:sulfatase-like hydrolase/transferase [Lentisphaera marina]|uniref:sulfatase family protein n=1 Tax=Lentisphaera marina TaxID=1111041 RepID=UPI0023673FA1|nr:sulfatase-like hydrolase/transferase [Lentisphaera marina]MDD7985234.1 sulfatase-like hydrolase/transferase [Lentisphaera marina]
MKTKSLLVAATVALFSPFIFAENAKPNVILIMADDLGWGDTGFNGSKVIKTPHLDQMAAEGLQLDRFYSASSVCSPTRASVLTGRNPYRTGVPTANQGFLRPEEIALPEVLKEQGYATGHFGKWHLGTLTHTEKDSNRGKPGNRKEFNPPKLHGYEDAFVTEAKVPTYDPMIKPKNFDKGESLKKAKNQNNTELSTGISRARKSLTISKAMIAASLWIAFFPLLTKRSLTKNPSSPLFGFTHLTSLA